MIMGVMATNYSALQDINHFTIHNRQPSTVNRPLLGYRFFQRHAYHHLELNFCNVEVPLQLGFF